MISLKRFSTRPIIKGQIYTPVKANLGSLITDQMYHGVSAENSTLLSGQYDDEDNFDVDPACDFSTDIFEVNPDSRAFHQSTPPTSEE